MHHLVVLGFLISQLGKILACGKKDEEEEEEAPGEFDPPSYICPLYLFFSFHLLLLPAIIAAATVDRQLRCSCRCQLKQPVCLQWRRLLFLFFPNYLLRLLCFNLKLIS